MTTATYTAGEIVRFRADSAYAKRHPGLHQVDGLATDDGSDVYLAGHVLRFPAKDLELVTQAPVPSMSVVSPVSAPAPLVAVRPAVSAPAPAPAMAATSPTPSTEGWATEYRASSALQREYLTESSYVAMRKHDARRAGLAYVDSGSVAAATDPHVAAWHASLALQQEFTTAQSYAAFKRAEARGAAHVHRSSVQVREARV